MENGTLFLFPVPVLFKVQINVPEHWKLPKEEFVVDMKVPDGKSVTAREAGIKTEKIPFRRHRQTPTSL